jgi:RNA polymerase sigma factor (sigma-70 family)
MNTEPSKEKFEHTGEMFSPVVSRAIAGDGAAWELLVERLTGLVIKATLEFDLSREERNDAFAATFLKLYEQLAFVRDPERLPGWVAKVARNEVIAVLRARRRHDEIRMRTQQRDPESGVTIDNFEDVENADEDRRKRAAVRSAWGRLPKPCQDLLRLLVTDPPMSYAELAERLHVPIGAIGPTRQRCLARIRRSPELTPFLKPGLL